MTVDEKLDRALASLARLEAHFMAPPAAPGASDADLDGEYGNPECRRDPKNWKGASYIGKKFSECPAEYLRATAGLLEWMAKKNDEEKKTTASGKPVSFYNRRDRMLALGWAKRNEGKTPPAPSQQEMRRSDFAPLPDDEGMPF